MIEDSKREVPRFKGTMHGMKMIVAEEGYRGIYRGLGPVVRFHYELRRIVLTTRCCGKGPIQLFDLLHIPP